ncbi:MAG: M1 family aminopeptidase [Gemmatimonadota bacterium]
MVDPSGLDQGGKDMYQRTSVLSMLLLAPLAWATMGSTPPEDTYPRQTGIDAVHYAFRITLQDDTDRIVAEADVSIRFLHGGVIGLFLDLASVSQTGGGKGMTVSAVTSDGAAVEWEHLADRLSLTLAAPPESGEVRTFTIRYAGIPAGGLVIGPNRYGERTFFSVNWPDKARQWLPMIDHPHDKATSEFIVTAPAHYQVVANGELLEEMDLGDGQRRTHWKESVPIPSWLNALGVARFASRHFGAVNGVPLQTWVFHQDRDAGIATFEQPVREAMAYFSESIGPYPYEKLANVEAAGMGGGMEHASVIFYGARSVTMEPATDLVTHEIAHQWFGDSVTESDWDDVWLSEGFATYLTLLSTEHNQGREAFVAGLERSRETVWAEEARDPEETVVHDNLSDMREVLSGLQYQKGAWILHMLRWEIGTENFWAGIREYYRRYRDSTATTADFVSLIEEISGKELDWFFDQWLHRTPSPALEGSWRYDAASGRVEVELEQTHPGAPYRLELEIGVTEAPGQDARIEVIQMTEKQQRFQLEVGGEPRSVALDPNSWALIRASFTKGEDS